MGESDRRLFEYPTTALSCIVAFGYRHKPSKDDENMYRWILASGIDYLVVATKADKISRQQMKNNVLLIRNTLQIPSEKDIICVSAQKRTGIENLWAAIDEYIVEEDVNPK